MRCAKGGGFRRLLLERYLSYGTSIEFRKVDSQFDSIRFMMQQKAVRFDSVRFIISAGGTNSVNHRVGPVESNDAICEEQQLCVPCCDFESLFMRRALFFGWKRCANREVDTNTFR